MRLRRATFRFVSWGFACVCAAAVCAAAGAAPGQEGPTSPLSITPITSTFIQSESATHYAIEDPVDLDGKKVTITWTLTIALVDKAEAQAPGEGPPGATEDPTCNNHGKTKQTGANEFVWHHGDQDSCDHGKMGPSGHQGIVKVVVAEVGGPWSCTAQFKGTNTGPGPKPTCTNGAAAGNPYLTGVLKHLAALDTLLDNAISGAQHKTLTGKAFSAAALHIDFEFGHVFDGHPSNGMSAIDELYVADVQLDGVGTNEDNPLHSDVNDFGSAATFLHKAALGLSSLDGSDAVQKGLDDLSHQATDLEHQMKKKEKTPAQGKTAAEELAKKKKALIAELPPMYGMKALTLYSTYARIGDAIAHAYDHAATDNVSASVSSLKTAREAKKSLESMVAKASR